LGGIKGRTPETIIAVVAVLLLVGALALGSSEESESSGAALPSAKHVHEIERDVERLRDHKFKKRVEPAVVSSDEAREAALRDLDKDYPPAQRKADEELLKLLALVPPDTDIVKVLGAISGEQVIGYYDTRRKELRLVSGNGADSPALVDITLAHELTHALEDQVFGLKESAGTTDDEASALTALHEGTATYVMNRYTNCCIPPGDLALGGLSSLFGGGDTTDLPPYVERTLIFSYTGGERFVEQLHRATGDWSLVDAALRSQPPVSTEQIIHPDKYVPFEKPVPVKLDTKAVLGAGWTRASDGVLGELDTRELLRLADPGVASDAAAGWGGGRYELWQRTHDVPGECDAPCRKRDALVLSWRWDTPRDARAFEPVLREYVTKALHGKPAGGAFAVDGGAAAISTRTAATTLAMAPDTRLARRLAERAPRAGR
jgi:hypothetical protein